MGSSQEILFDILTCKHLPRTRATTDGIADQFRQKGYFEYKKTSEALTAENKMRNACYACEYDANTIVRIDGKYDGDK